MYGIPTETPRADQGSNDFVPDLIGSRNFEVPLGDMNDPDNEQVSSDTLKVSERKRCVSAENFHSKNHNYRKRKPYESKVRDKLLEPERIRKLFRRNLVLAMSSTEMEKIKCCQQNCFSRTDCVFLSSESSRVFLWGNEDRRRYLQKLLETSSMIFRFSGKKVCYKLLESSFKFSRNLQSSVKKSYTNGTSFRSIQTSKHLASPSRDGVICFLERFAESTADRIPDTNERHLPLFQKKLSMKCSVNSTLFCMVQRKPTSLTYFYSTGKKYCRDIKVRRIQRFTKCTECEYIRSALERPGTYVTRTDSLLDRRRLHIEMVAKRKKIIPEEM